MHRNNGLKEKKLKDPCSNYFIAQHSSAANRLLCFISNWTPLSIAEIPPTFHLRWSTPDNSKILTARGLRRLTYAAEWCWWDGRNMWDMRQNNKRRWMGWLMMTIGRHTHRVAVDKWNVNECQREERENGSQWNCKLLSGGSDEDIFMILEASEDAN